MQILKRIPAAVMPVTKLRTVISCSLSAAISYGIFVGADGLDIAGIPDTIVILTPGLVFALALLGSIRRPLSLIWRIVIAVVIIAGWYAAYQSAIAIEASLYIAGGVAGAVGGAALFVVLLSHPQRRTASNAALLVAAGGAIGAICLPAGFLFGKPEDFHYLFLTFLPWQVGMGLLVGDDWDRWIGTRGWAVTP